MNNYGMMAVKQRIASIEFSLVKLKKQETKFTDELETALTQYAELQRPTFDLDGMELISLVKLFALGRVQPKRPGAARKRAKHG